MTEANIPTSPAKDRSPIGSAALIALPIRLVMGWAFFSAFWRRTALKDALDPDAAGYVGEKFNHFLPNALIVKPAIEHLLAHPGQLHAAMVLFTVAEGVVGLFLLVGLCTRAMSLAAIGLSLGILLGSGWLGTTCLDEWQIGVLSSACAFVLLLTGGGRYSLDHALARRRPALARSKWFARLASGEWAVPAKAALAGSLAILLVDLATNQIFHGGVYGPLHNKSVRPKIEISDARIADNILQFSVYRTEGVDVYGSFLVEAAVVDTQTGAAAATVLANQLGHLPAQAIRNTYVAKVKPAGRSLLVPLGAKAQVTLDVRGAQLEPRHPHALVLTDISGAQWKAPLKTDS
ncbi:TQO small subunit DoxD [Segniliparus rugosus]|uniref:TQO small subunit DoxD n=1 Tax=Segniliparus rugosus TaxID=286804 RepID=UPI003CC7106C